jgi:hypothetical protein
VLVDVPVRESPHGREPLELAPVLALPCRLAEQRVDPVEGPVEEHVGAHHLPLAGEHEGLRVEELADHRLGLRAQQELPRQEAPARRDLGAGRRTRRERAEDRSGEERAGASGHDPDPTPPAAAD